MIERGHEHSFYPVSVVDREGGTRVILSRCNASPATPANPMPACSLEEERVFHGAVPVSIRYRFGGLWFSALDLLRLLPIGVEECPVCGGDRMLVPCETCFGVGVVSAGGGPLVAPNLHVRA